MKIKFNPKNIFYFLFIISIMIFKIDTFANLDTNAPEDKTDTDIVNFQDDPTNSRKTSLITSCSFSKEKKDELIAKQQIKKTGKTLGDYYYVEIKLTPELRNKNCKDYKGETLIGLIDKKKFDNSTTSSSDSTFSYGANALTKIPLSSILADATSKSPFAKATEDIPFGYCDRGDEYLRTTQDNSSWNSFKSNSSPLMSKKQTIEELKPYQQVASLLNPSLDPFDKLSQALSTDNQLNNLTEILEQNTSKLYNTKKHTFFGEKEKSQWKFLCVNYIKEALLRSNYTDKYIGGEDSVAMAEVLIKDYGWKDIYNEEYFKAKIKNCNDIPQNTLLIYGGGDGHSEFKLAENKYGSDHISDSIRTRDCSSFSGEGRTLKKILVPPDVYQKATSNNSNLATN